jgi:hypothetical protein
LRKAFLMSASLAPRGTLRTSYGSRIGGRIPCGPRYQVKTATGM